MKSVKINGQWATLYKPGDIAAALKLSRAGVYTRIYKGQLPQGDVLLSNSHNFYSESLYEKIIATMRAKREAEAARKELLGM